LYGDVTLNANATKLHTHMEWVCLIVRIYKLTRIASVVHILLF